MLTGEPLPVDKSPGDQVIGGDHQRAGTARSSRPPGWAAETALAQIIRLVQEAQGSKAPIQAPGRPGGRGLRARSSSASPCSPSSSGGSLGGAFVAGHDPHGGGAGDRLSLRPGAGHADGHHGRHRARAPKQGILFKNSEALETAHTTADTSCWTRPAPITLGRAGGDRRIPLRPGLRRRIERPAAAGRFGRKRLRAPARQGHRRGGRGRAGSSCCRAAGFQGRRRARGRGAGATGARCAWANPAGSRNSERRRLALPRRSGALQAEGKTVDGGRAGRTSRRA